MKPSHTPVFVLLLAFANPLSAEQLRSDEQNLIQDGIRLYAECIQQQAMAVAIQTERDVESVVVKCSEERKLLEETAPGRGIADKIDDKVKTHVRSNG